MKTKINNIDTVKYNGPVYNMELRPVHSTLDDQYYIDIDTGLVVHNCHPRDNIALRWLAKELDLGYDIFDTIIRSREVQAFNMAKKLREISFQTGLPIIIHGRAYKPDVPYLDGSYSELVGEYARYGNDIGQPITVMYSDPLTGDYVADDTVGIILLAHNKMITYGEGEQGWYFKPGKDSIIVDPWRKLEPIDGCQVIHYGNTRDQK